MSETDSVQGGTLVLGGSGFLGAHVVAQAVRAAQEQATFADPLGSPVIGVARRPAEAPLFSSPRDAAFWRAADLSRPGAAVELLDELRPVAVVCCAALSRVADCEADAELARRVNVDLPVEVAGWTRQNGVRLVHVSTDLVFGEHLPERATGFREDDPTGPLSEYGRTKAEAEGALLDRDPAALVVRLPLLYGNSGGRGIGASDSLLEAVERDLQPSLFTDEHRTPLEVSNAAEALVELVDSERSGILHVAGPDRVSRYTLAISILEAMGLPVDDAKLALRASRRELHPELGPRPGDTSLDASTARGLLECELLGVPAGLERAIA